MSGVVQLGDAFFCKQRAWIAAQCIKQNKAKNPQAALRLFCFPHAGGGSSAYRTWGYPVTPALYMALSIWVAYSQFRSHWQESALVALTLVIGAGVYAATVGRTAGKTVEPHRSARD